MKIMCVMIPVRAARIVPCEYEHALTSYSAHPLSSSFADRLRQRGQIWSAFTLLPISIGSKRSLGTGEAVLTSTPSSDLIPWKLRTRLPAHASRRPGRRRTLASGRFA